MVNGVENNLVLNSKPNVGVLTPPNALHKPQLFSDKEAEMQFLMIFIRSKASINSKIKEKLLYQSFLRLARQQLGQDGLFLKKQ